jgi:hypothetical protein
VLFIDEIHRLSPVVEEILYPALEDYQIDIMIGEGPAARSIKLDLQPFTLVGATTRAGMLTNPLRDRFGIVARLEFYTPEELARIVTAAPACSTCRSMPGCAEIARRSRGTPRIANRLLRRVRDYAQVKGNGRVDVATADKALAMLDVDPLGFDLMDRKLLEAIVHRFDGGPVGLENLAAAIGEEARHDRGRDRALPDPAGLPAAHATRGRHLGVTPPTRRRSVRRVSAKRWPLRPPPRGAGCRSSAERPGAPGLQVESCRGAVQAIHHSAMGNNRDGLPGMCLGELVHGTDAARIESVQRFATVGREFGLALRPAARFGRPA